MAEAKEAVKDREATAKGGDVVDKTTGEVTTAKSNAPAIPADLDYSADAGAGFEGQTSEDISIPFLMVAQPMSPECTAEGSTIKPGMILNRGSGEGFVSVDFIPAVTQHQFLEWVPREKGGGLVARHEIDSDFVKNIRATQPFGDYTHPETGNDLVETFTVFGLALSGEGVGMPAIMGFSSTGIKPYKEWMYMARALVIRLPDNRTVGNLPLFSHSYRVSSLRREKAPHVWFVPVIRFSGDTAEDSRVSPRSELYAQAKGVREGINAGRIKVDLSKMGGREGGGVAVDPEKAPY